MLSARCALQSAGMSGTARSGRAAQEGDLIVKIQDFADMREFERIISNWAVATGMAAVAIGPDGKYISERYNFTDFCNKYTRTSKEGCRRCEKCDREGKGVYSCHAGLTDFAVDITVNGELAGKVLGGQVLEEALDEERIREIAREIGVNEDEYAAAARKVKVCPKKVIQTSVEMLRDVVNYFVHAEYAKNQTRSIFENLVRGVNETNDLIETIKKETSTLRSIQSRQKILALNASIEAARAGDMGAGFAVVASEVGKLSERSSVVNKNIEEVVNRIYEVVTSMKQKEATEGSEIADMS